MGDIIEFPSKAIQEWAIIDRTIREILTKAGAPADMQNEILSHTKEFFQRFNANFNMNFELPSSLSEVQKQDILSSINQTLRTFGEQLHEYTSSILLERVQVEIKLYKLRHDMDNM